MIPGFSGERERNMEMELKRASQKREFRPWKVKNNLLEAIAKVNGGSVVSHSDENGVTRMKIVVKKQDLKQMLEEMRGGKNYAHQPLLSLSPSPSLLLEQRLNLLRRKLHFRGRLSSWRPALHSIPEEL